ncbi:MAG: cytochrome c5 family protein [Gammaproteobacteria bacterium]|nr:MAG: cytochrome c5 family protein [Chloroflexota bacterium]TDJ22539.1 MAG: cytochrome c5 family protein [Gammaproteobacteria bacterium]
MKRPLTLAAAIVCLSLGLPAAADRVPPGTDDDIRERLEPLGEVCVVGSDCAAATVASSAVDAVAGPRSGEEVYNRFCFACHTAGVAGAPKLGSAEDWAPRLAKGMDAMWETTVTGLGAMPPKGTCMACTDEEMQAAIDYMSGG